MSYGYWQVIGFPIVGKRVCVFDVVAFASRTSSTAVICQVCVHTKLESHRMQLVRHVPGDTSTPGPSGHQHIGTPCVLSIMYRASAHTQEQPPTGVRGPFSYARSTLGAISAEGKGVKPCYLDLFAEQFCPMCTPHRTTHLMPRGNFLGSGCIVPLASLRNVIEPASMLTSKVGKDDWLYGCMVGYYHHG